MPELRTPESKLAPTRAVPGITFNMTPIMHRINYIITLALAAAFALAPITSLAQRTNVPGYFRPYDQRGVNVFEETRLDTVPFDGFEVYWGGAFTQQFQALSHSNEAEPVLNDAGANLNELIEIGNGFNLATANLILDAQLAEGVRLNLVTYLSSRHHSEAWVKGGFVQVDGVSFLGSETLDNLFRYLRVKMGHFEVNYGDAHFRRSDNGNAIWNPFVGNYIMDAFATEIGGEVYGFFGDAFAMVAVTGGEIQGSIVRPDDRAPSFYGKVGYDSRINDLLRVRLTGSAYHTEKSISNTLYAGDRAGSRYYLVTEPVGATPAANFRSGRANPGLSNHVTAIQFNPFIKYGGLELFGVVETATGGTKAEKTADEDRTWTQLGVEAIYRFLPREQLYIGGRYNTVSGTLAGSRADIRINRIQIGAGWFATPNLLLKAEYVNQKYEDYPATNILHGAEFNGFMIEGVLAF